MIRWLYEKRLLAGLSTLPSHICFMITSHDMEDDPDKIVSVSRWCVEITDAVRASTGQGEPGWGIDGVTFHISTLDAGESPPYIGNVRKIGEFARLTLHLGESEETIV